MEKAGRCLRVYTRHLFCPPLALCGGFPDGSVVRNLPAMQETRVPSLGQENLLEKGMAILPWRIPWTEEPGRLQSMGSPRVRHD